MKIIKNYFKFLKDNNNHNVFLTTIVFIRITMAGYKLELNPKELYVIYLALTVMLNKKQ